MKNLLAFILCLIVLSSGAQGAEGIGKFKIHKTKLSIIDSLKSELGGIDSIRNIMDEVDVGYRGELKLYEILCDTNKMGHEGLDAAVYAVSYPGAKIFYLSSYTIAGIEIKHIHLTFLKGELVEFESDGSIAIDNAMDLKYGSSQISVKEKDVHCSLVSSGGEITYKEKTYTKTWPGHNCVCTGTLCSYYDSNCKPRLTHDFSISDVVAENKIHDYTHGSRKRYEERVNAYKRKNLSEF